MAKTFRFSPAWYIIAIFLASGWIIATLLFINIENMKRELLSYQNTTTACTSGILCRQIIDVTVIRGTTWKYSFKSTRGIRTENPQVVFKSKRYVIDIALPNSITKSVEIFPNVSANYQGFGIENVYSPSDNDLTFVENNFPTGKQIRVEIWNNKITFLFVRSTLKTQNSPDGQFVIFVPVYPEQQKPPLSMGQSDLGGEIAIPTSENPLSALEKAQNEFSGALIGIAIVNISVLVLVIRFRKL